MQVDEGNTNPNIFNMQSFIEIVKIQITEHVDNEILRFEKQIDEIIQRILNKPIKGKYE